MTKAVTREMLEDYRNAPSGIGPFASEWQNKPHRLVYDLIDAISAIIRERDEAVASIGRHSLPCSRCGLPVVFEFTVENQTWNRIVRANNIPEYLCLWCFAALAKDEMLIHIGVNISAGSVFSGWCGHDVPGAYSAENDDWEKLETDRDEWKRRAEKLHEAARFLWSERRDHNCQCEHCVKVYELISTRLQRGESCGEVKS